MSIAEKGARDLLQGTEDLRKISEFLRPILIDTHNKRVDRNFLVGLVHVLLFVLTFGIFDYRDTLRIKNFASSLDKMGVTKTEQPIEQDSSLYQLRLTNLLSMQPVDRDLLLDKMGLLDKWTTFFINHADKGNLDKLSDFNKAVIASYTLEDFKNAADLEKTVLVCFQDDAKAPDLEGVPVSGRLCQLALCDVVHPHLRKATVQERREIARNVPDDTHIPGDGLLSELKQLSKHLEQVEAKGFKKPEIEAGMATFSKQEVTRIRQLADMQSEQRQALRELLKMLEV